jgi:hypothetical protein
MIAGGISASHAANSSCSHDQVLSSSACHDAAGAGTAIGIGVLLFVWFFGFIVLSIIWFMSRPQGQR